MPRTKQAYVKYCTDSHWIKYNGKQVTQRIIDHTSYFIFLAEIRRFVIILLLFVRHVCSQSRSPSPSIAITKSRFSNFLHRWQAMRDSFNYIINLKKRSLVEICLSGHLECWPRSKSRRSTDLVRYFQF